MLGLKVPKWERKQKKKSGGRELFGSLVRYQYTVYINLVEQNKQKQNKTKRNNNLVQTQERGDVLPILNFWECDPVKSITYKTFYILYVHVSKLHRVIHIHTHTHTMHMFTQYCWQLRVVLWV